MSFGCGNSCILVYFFFRILVIFFKSGKIPKNGKSSKKIKNEAGAMYCLIYIFSDFIVDVLIFKKNIFLNFA